MIPSALEHVQEIAGPSGRVAVFLDYDGTLTPIVSHPKDAWLADSMRQTLQELAAQTPVAILSGRDLDDVRQRAGIDDIVYAGSHGFDIAGPHGLRRQMATEFLPKLDTVENELHKRLDGITSAMTSRMKTLSVHLSDAVSVFSCARNRSPPPDVIRSESLRKSNVSCACSLSVCVL